MFVLNYIKNHTQPQTKELMTDFKNEKLTNFRKIQNYIPLYSKYFNCNETNWNHINLNHISSITRILKKETDNIFNIQLEDNRNVDTFMKFSPLIDPIKYLAGKYKHVEEEVLFSLPKHECVSNDTDVFPKVNDVNNVSYVDGFFSYLSSMLLNRANFIHGLDFYGSYLGVQNKFMINVADDIDFLENYDYFSKQRNKLYKIYFDIQDDYKYDTRDFKKRLRFTEKTTGNISLASMNDTELNELFLQQPQDVDISSNNITSLQNITNLDEFITYNNEDINENSVHSVKSSSTVSSSCSSRSSNTDVDTIIHSDGTDIEEDSDSDDERDDNSLLSDEEDILNELQELSDSELTRLILEEEPKSDSSVSDNIDSDCSDTSSISSCDSIKVNVTINKFPVQVIALEKLDNTLDHYMTNNKISSDEWKSILFQIVATLIVYQKVFDFTHNDLHTNNIMYYETDQEFIEYKINDTYYTVPTYGKIYKIIDFGRAIYRFMGNLHCSDSFNFGEDAATQYNFPPFYNKKKPIIHPNKSFDLCRLGCSLFDHFFNGIRDIEKCCDPIALKIAEWCSDDKGRNILYKLDDSERYPGFKLYKMIARTVHKHIPSNEINAQIYFDFKSNERSNKSSVFIDIDSFEKVYT